MSKVSASVRATVTIEFHIGSWDADSRVSDLREAGSREAKQIVCNRMHSLGMKVIGEPEIKIMTFEPAK
jgi:hypothetical protein